jgi:hypothetical protein
LGERVLCKHEVVGSIPSASTMNLAGDGRKETAAVLHPAKSVEKYRDTEFFASPSFEALDHSKASARSGIFDIVKKWV